MLGGGGNPSAWWEVGRRPPAPRHGSGDASDLTTHRPGQRLHRRSPSTTVVGRRRQLPGGRRSRRSRIPRAASSASTRAAACCCRGRSTSRPGDTDVAGRATSSRPADHAADDARRRRQGRCEPPASRRPRPLLPAAAGRSVHRPRCRRDPTAAPAPDWNAADQRPTATGPTPWRATSGAMSWDLGPTLAGWLETGDPVAYDGFVDGERGANGHGPAVPPRHPAAGVRRRPADRDPAGACAISSCASDGARPGCGCPRRRVDLATLRLMADAGIPHTILAPWQVDDISRHAAAATGSSSAMAGRSWSPSTTAGLSARGLVRAAGDGRRRRVRRERLVPRFARPTLPRRRAARLVVIATDGELYGHHQPFRDRFLARLLARRRRRRSAPYDVVTPRPTPWPSRARRPSATTASTSGPRGAAITASLRWSGRVRRASPDGRWKAPLRAALERLAARHRRRSPTSWRGACRARPTRGPLAMPMSTSSSARRSRARSRRGGSDGARRIRRRRHLVPGPAWRPNAGASRCSRATAGSGTTRRDRRRRGCSATAAGRSQTRRRAPGGRSLEARLVADLALFSSPGHGIDGAEIYRRGARRGRPRRRMCGGPGRMSDADRSMASGAGRSTSTRLSTPNRTARSREDREGRRTTRCQDDEPDHRVPTLLAIVDYAKSSLSLD